MYFCSPKSLLNSHAIAFLFPKMHTFPHPDYQFMCCVMPREQLDFNVFTNHSLIITFNTLIDTHVDFHLASCIKKYSASWTSKICFQLFLSRAAFVVYENVTKIDKHLNSAAKKLTIQKKLTMQKIKTNNKVIARLYVNAHAYSCAKEIT